MKEMVVEFERTHFLSSVAQAEDDAKLSNNFVCFLLAPAPKR